ncbi:hypothetical protein ABIC33_000164 [Variovorax sp. 1140]
MNDRKGGRDAGAPGELLVVFGSVRNSQSKIEINACF